MRCELVTGVQTCALPILVGEIEPDAVGAGEQQRGNQEDRPARHLAFRRRRREMQLGLAVEAVDLCLEALDDLVAVETEVIGVAEHETHRVGGARQLLEQAAPDGVEIGISDAEHIGDRSEEHTSALQSLMRISSADFCSKNKTKI